MKFRDQRYLAERSDGTWWLEDWADMNLTPLEVRSEGDSDDVGSKLCELLGATDYLLAEHAMAADVFTDRGMVA